MYKENTRQSSEVRTRDQSELLKFQSSDIRTLDKVQKLEHETKTDTIPKKDKIKNISKYPF